MGYTLYLSSTEWSGLKWTRVEWNYSRIEGFDNKIGTTLASARALCVMNIEWDYSYYQPWSDNEWLVEEMIAMREETLMEQNEDITM